MNTLAVTLQQSSAVSQAIYGNIILFNRNKAIIIVINFCNVYICGLKLNCIRTSIYSKLLYVCNNNKIFHFSILFLCIHNIVYNYNYRYIHIGNFSAPKQQEIVVAKGGVLELLRPDDTGKVISICSTPVFGIIRSLLPFRLSGSL